MPREGRGQLTELGFPHPPSESCRRRNSAYRLGLLDDLEVNGPISIGLKEGMTVTAALFCGILKAALASLGRHAPTRLTMNFQ